MAAKKAFFQRVFENVIWNFNLEDPNQKIDGKTVAEIFGGKESVTGETISEDKALRFSAVWASNRVISDPISYMPFNVYEIDGESKNKSDKLKNLFVRPNRYTSWPVFVQRILTHRNLWGNGIAIKEYSRRSGDVEALHIIHPSKIQEIGVSGNQVYYVYENDNGKRTTKNGDDVVHFPGLGDTIVGKSVIEYAKDDIGLEFSAQKYGGQVFKDGGDPRGMFSFKTPLKSDQMDEIIQRVGMQLQKSKHLVVGSDSTYTPFAMKPADAEFISSRNFNVSTICRWFGVPPWKIAHLIDGATYNNVEMMNLGFLQDTLSPIVNLMEYELNYKLFREEERDRFIVEAKMSEYLRADSKARAEIMRTEIQNGVATPNEWRLDTGRNPKDGGDELMMQSGTLPLVQLKNQNDENVV